MPYIVDISSEGLKSGKKTRLFYATHGRVRLSSIEGKKYMHYYPGFFDKIPYRKIKKGSYICTDIPIVPKDFWQNVTIKKTDLEVNLTDTETARNRFRMKYALDDIRPTNL